MEQNKTAAASLSRLLQQGDESSQKHQLKCFFNYVLLGQWELARSVSNLICQNPRREDRSRVLVTLIDVASNPYEQSIGSKTVTSPEQLSWLALQEYERVTNSGTGTQGVDISSLKQDVEFRLLLVQECRGVDKNILCEVYQYFRRHHGTGQTYSQLSTYDARESLPRSVSDFIKQQLRERPATGHLLVSFLMPKNPASDSKESEALQGLYVDSITALINSLPSAQGPKREETRSKIFELLSLYDPEPYWNYLQIRQLFTHLITLASTDGANFSTDKVLEVLMGRKQGYLVDEFVKLLQEIDTAQNSEVRGDMPEEQRLTLHLLAGKDRDVCWQRYFVACLKWNKHCLGLIMETCISLVKGEQFQMLGQFLDTPELRCLRPVVLLACWTYCRSSDSARRLLDTLWMSAGPGTHPVLTAGCKRLAYQLSLIKWCLERARPLLESSQGTSSQTTYGEQATKLLHGLETHSVLFVLHRSTHLAALDSQEVLRLLQNVARDGEQQKKEKSVHFQDDNQAIDTKEPISAEQEHDICIYRSFCAIRNVMDAIVFCFQNSDLDLMNPIRLKNMLKPKQLSEAVSISTVINLSSSEGDESSTGKSSVWEENQKKAEDAGTQEASFKELYQKHVWQKLQDAREHLQHLYPLAYRVEILENIFSLLFCRHNDIFDGGTLTREGDSDNEVEGESKVDSQENLNMSASMVSEEDGESEKNWNSQKDETSQVNQQTDSAFGSLGPEGKFQRSSSIEYDTPFPEQQKRETGNSQFKYSRPRNPSVSLYAQSCSKPDYSCGFLANDYLVRDVLSLLKEALVDLSALKFKMQGQGQGQQTTAASSRQAAGPPVKSSGGTVSSGSGPAEIQSGRVKKDNDSARTGDNVARSRSGDGNAKSSYSPERFSSKGGDPDFSPALEKMLSRTVCTSVTADTMQKRLAQLTQHVHEAQWRFQLVTHEMIPRQPGRVLEEIVTVTDDDSYVACIADEWMSCKRPQSAGAGLRGHSSKRSMNSIGTAGIGPQHPSQQSVIARMLSSPDSLLTMCLTRGNIAQAAQVVKLLKINEKTREAAEAAFTGMFNTAAKSISALSITTKEARSSSGSKKFSLEAVKNAAAAGVANATLSKFVDDLLATPNVPPLPKPEWVGERSQDKAMAELFALDTSTAILVDLACTTCQTWELCNNISNIIKAKGTVGRLSREDGDTDRSDSEVPCPIKEKKKGKNAFPRCDLKGCKRFFLQMDSLLQLGHGDADHWTTLAQQEVSAISGSSSGVKPGPSVFIPGVSAPPTITITSNSAAQQSLMQRFRSGGAVLNAEVMKQYESNIHEVKQAFEQANQALLVTSRLDRQDSIHIDESHFAKSPGIKQSPLSFSPGTSRTSSSSSLGSSCSRETPGKIEAPILHQRMKHLIAAMEKFVPHGGLFLLLIYGKMERGMLRNYLLSMYEHVKELAYMVAECESKTAETLILPKNYFSILEEGPVDILGRLMFVKRMLPARLEGVAKKLSLNLTHIIVQSCCPQIPSKHLPLMPTPCIHNVERVGAKFVYNSGCCDSKDTPDPEALVRAVLTDILSAMQDISSKVNDKDIFTETCGKELVRSEHYSRMVARLRGLQNTDLTLMDSEDKQLCFFANLLNLMTIHYHLHNIHQHAQLEEAEQREEVPSWGLKGLEGRDLLDMVTKLGAFCYRVGQLGVLSLFDLKYVMLHHGQNLSHKWKSLITSGARKLASNDPMSEFSPPAEPRLLFVISDGCLSSPPIQVLEPDKLNQQLDAATKSFLLHTVKLDPAAKQISLPLLLTYWSSDEPVEKHSSESLFDNLLNFVSMNAMPSQAEVLDEMTKNIEDKAKAKAAAGSATSLSKTHAGLEISLSDYTTDFAYVFIMDDVAAHSMQSQKEQQESSSPKLSSGILPDKACCHSSSNGTTLSAFLPQHYLIESSGSQLDAKVSMAKPASYQLTPVTLDYVRETSGLVATLLTLLCADELDDDSEAQQASDNDHFPSSGLHRHRASSDISLVDIRSYRYHRLVDDFPILQRHLLTYIVPLAGADNPEISHSGEPILKFVTNVIDEDVKVCLFSLHDSLQFLEMLHTMASRLTSKRQWQALVPVLRSIPEVVVDTYPHLQLLHDFVVSCWAHEFSAALPKSSSKSASHMSASKSWSMDVNLLHQLRKMYCPEAQARVVVAVCNKLPVDWGLDLLELCLSQSIQPGLRSAVKAKHHYLNVYHKIQSCIKTLQIKLAMQQSELIPDTSTSSSLPTSSKEMQKLLAKYEDWRYVAEESLEKPREVMAVLIHAGDLGVVKDWAKLCSLPPALMMEMEMSYMMSLLSASDLLPAYQALEALRSSRPVDCLEICQSLLLKLDDQHKVKFLVTYMLRHLEATMPSDDVEDLRLMQIGAKALLCIPKSMRGEYSHLIICPHLILEQLLMNMKGELAGQVFEKVREDFKEIKDSKLQMAQNQFNLLLTNYARKALEVTVAQVNNESRSSAQGSSRPSSSGSASSKEDGKTAHTSQRLSADAVKIRKRNSIGTVWILRPASVKS